MTPLAATEAERLAFEEAMLRLKYFEGHELERDTYGYTDEIANAAWLAWQAARASQQSAAQPTTESLSNPDPLPYDPEPLADEEQDIRGTEDPQPSRTDRRGPER